MLELILGTYGVVCWLVFKKFKLVPTNTYTVCTAILIGGVIMLSLLILLIRFHPQSKDARLYVVTTPILPQVRGMVIESATEGQTVKKGDVLFKLDPRPYQYEVDRLEAQLAEANTTVAQLEERLKAAESATKQASSNLAASESDFDRQAREDLERAKEEVKQKTAQADFARTQESRYKELLSSGSVAQVDYDRVQKQFEAATAELKQAETAQRQAEEKIKSGGDRLASAREAVSEAQAEERDARAARDAQIGGVNPEVRQIMAALDNAKWELDQTVVRAPSDGETVQVFLRPGQMVVPMPLSPVMVFIPSEKPVLVATYPQNVIANFKPGLESELAFKAYPGRIYKATVKKIIPYTPEGQLAPSGQLRSASTGKSQSRIQVQFEYGEDVAALKLPGGAQGYAAIYTEHMHPLSIIRKILLRIKGYENYLFLP